ncbi:ABC transporter ATP-binding protein [candidate division KSB1 bacterium 4572_119]|nr:MAG: ABC transporter ATP-binding protein [candidate division KSB1 bacterium 4572_119]
MQFVINRKTFISMLFIALTLLGFISYRQLPVELLPDAELPFLIIQVGSAQEVDPDYMEQQAIIPLEGAASTLEGIDKIESWADRRQGMIMIYYNQNVKIKYAYLKLQEKVNAVKSTLSEDFFVNVLKIDTEQITNMFMSLQVRGSGGLDRVREIFDKKVVRELENISGIANVEAFGGKQKSVEIILSEEASEAYNITPSQVRSLISQNSQSKTFVGQTFEKNKQYFVNLVAEYTDVRDLENIVVRRDGPILLKDVADIYVGFKEETSISRVNGKEALTVQLVRDAQVNLIKLSHDTRKVIDELNVRLKPEDLEIVIQSDSAEEMEKNIDLIIQLALFGGLLAVIILYLFLRNFSLVSVIALAIPISIYTAFNFFYAYDISINSLTLVGIALAVGMLLDNSIVVLENIYRLASRDKQLDESVVKGVKEIWRSVFAATLTTIVIFLPFIFASDFFIRLLGRHISVSIISTLVVSLVVALLLIPMVTHFFLKRKRKSELTQLDFNIVSPKNRLLQIYRVLLKSSMRFPPRTILGAILVLFFSLVICFALSVDISKEPELTDFNLYVTMPSGSTLEASDLVVEDLEKRLEDIEEKQDLVSQIYEEEAILTFKLKEDYEKYNGRSIPQIKEEIKKQIRDFRAAEVDFEQPVSSRRFSGGMGRNPGAGFERMLNIGSQTEKVLIKGRDFDMMRNVAEDIRYYLEELSSMDRVNFNIEENRPEVHMLFDTQLLSHYNILISTLSAELGSFQKEFTTGMKYKQGTDEYDIVIKNANLEDKTIDDLRQLRIPSQTGGTHELEQISRVIFSFGMSRINRVNQEKQIEVTYRLLPEINSSKSLLQAARDEIDDLVASLDIPPGIAIEVIHEERELGEFKFLIGAAILLVYMILAAVFESLATPIVVMFAIPMAAIGSLWAVILTDNSILNPITLIGFLILLGVVVNNGIILIDYTRILRSRGHSRSRALMNAGQARVRPILITTITTIVAMLPLAMGKAEYITQIGAPFAITVIGGLSLSTLLTLVFIPTVYTGLEVALSWMKKVSLKAKLLWVLLLAGSVFLILTNVYSLLWQIVLIILVIVLIPAMTYFVTVGLRRAKEDVVNPDEPLLIKIKHVVKIYDDYSRFLREWKKGKIIREKAGLAKQYNTWRDFDILFWQIPLLGFLVYFVYFYLRSSFWIFIVSHGVFFYILYFWKSFEIFINNLHKKTGRKLYRKIVDWFYPGFLWGFPLFNLIIFYFRWENVVVLILIAIVWYLALAIYVTSNKLHRDKVNIMRLKGRFSGIRKTFYQFVQIIPVIGKKKNPFKALAGVSMEIGSGMFGLLGPNGAGKTTLMRIICGILEQTRGTIWINGIDLKEKREEFQGLIGYLPQEFGTYENMSAYEFLEYQAILKNLYDKDEREKRVNYVLDAVHLSEKKDQKIGSFSGGMKQRIGIAQTLLHLPRILVVDEPTAGLDPRERIRFRNLLVELARERIVIFSTHIIEDISSSCNRVAVLNRGRLCYLGDPQEMTKIAEGKIWQFNLEPDGFEKIRDQHPIIHHMRDGEKIRVRVLSEDKPVPEAKSARPTLEDAYLWLLRKTEQS